MISECWKIYIYYLHLGPKSDEGDVDHLVDRALCMREAPGSKPGISTSFYFPTFSFTALVSQRNHFGLFSFWNEHAI